MTFLHQNITTAMKDYTYHELILNYLFCFLFFHVLLFFFFFLPFPFPFFSPT